MKYHPNPYFVVGRRAPDTPFQIICGVYESKELADAACEDEFDFVIRFPGRWPGVLIDLRWNPKSKFFCGPIHQPLLPLTEND